ncbi:MAG: terminase family protein [Anaerolineae bacterium]|nr:terminase family protein [Anaerolineae bacterium]
MEVEKCTQSLFYFILNYCFIEEPALHVTSWISFQLWPFQTAVLRGFLQHTLVTILKARQLGITWLVVAYALWLMLFRPGSIVLIFSAGDTEAKNLLARIKGMHEHLPEWLQAAVTSNDEHKYFLANGSRAQSFASTKKAGRSMTASLVILDEADWLMWFQATMAAIKPTIDGGGQLIMLSTPDKEKPGSSFKAIWKAAQAGLNNYKAIFIPWSARPDRDEAWYGRQVADAETIDDVHQEYPATPAEALSGRSATKRFQPGWINGCSDFIPAIQDPKAPAVPGLVIYERPCPGREYVIGADCSEGDVTSDATPWTVFDVLTWAEVAHGYGVFEPDVQAGYLVQTAVYYNNATICPERNNHGHSVILAMRELLKQMPGVQKPVIYRNPFDKKPGWLSNIKFKPQAINLAAEVMREGSCTIRTEATAIEIAGVESSTLSALEGETDDRAMSYFIGLAALKWPGVEKRPSQIRSHSDRARPQTRSVKPSM